MTNKDTVAAIARHSKIWCFIDIVRWMSLQSKLLFQLFDHNNVMHAVLSQNLRTEEQEQNIVWEDFGSRQKERVKE